MSLNMHIFIFSIILFISGYGWAEAVKILPLGDSITHGGNGQASYRRNLWQMLQSEGYSVDFVGSHDTFNSYVPSSLHDFDLDHEGHWAWETGELNNYLTGWLQGYEIDIVLLHVGTNDVNRNQTISSTLSELEDIFYKLRAKNPNVVILIAQIIPMRWTDVSTFNTSLLDWAPDQNTAASPVFVVDQYTGHDRFTDNYDNYHPNNSGELKMATNWFNALQPILDNQETNLGLNGVVKRAEIAKPILLKKYGDAFIPPTVSGSTYTDVPTNDFKADWVEKLTADGITEGCATNLFCPEMIITKEQLSKILLKAKHGSGYAPPVASGSLFTDVTSSSFAVDWIEALYNQGISEGCSATTFCPKEAVTVKAFVTMLNKALP